MDIKNKEYIDAIEQYREINKKAKELDDKKDQIRQTIAELLHRDKENKKEIQLEDGENWSCGYQTVSKTNTDLKLLLEYVGPHKYSEIVTEKPSTFLTIRKAAKSKTKHPILTEQPVLEESLKPSILTGTILS